MCELGARLRAAREASGRSLQEWARALRVSVEVLEALETCRFDDLPEPVLAKGHLRRYARALGLDPEALVALYPEPQTPPLPTTVSTRRRARRPLWLLFPLVLVLAGLGLWFRPHAPAPSPSPETPAATPAPPPTPQKPVRVRLSVTTEPKGARVYLDGYFLGHAPVALEVEPGQRQLRVEAEGYQSYERELTLSQDRSLKVHLNPLPKPKPKPASTPKTLRLVVTARSWIRVTTPEGKRLYEKTALPGTELTFPLPVVVKTGNAGGVRAYLGDEDQGPMGRAGQVVTRRFEAPKPGR